MSILVFSIFSTPLWQNAGGVLPLAFFCQGMDFGARKGREAERAKWVAWIQRFEKRWCSFHKPPVFYDNGLRKKNPAKIGIWRFVA